MKEWSLEKAVVNKYPYLRPDIKPIIGCVGNIDEHNHDKSPEDLYKSFKYFESRKASNIDWGEDLKFFKENNIKNDDVYSYVISPVDSKDKFSRGYADCTGIFVVGKNKNSGENISFVTHQFPGEFLYLSKPKFIKDICDSLDDIKNQSLEGTIDVAIIGGLSAEGSYQQDGIIHSYKEEYEQSIKLINTIILKKLGFNPNIISGPKKGGQEHVYYDTHNRRIYLGRNSLESSPVRPGFNAADLEKQKENNWEFKQEQL